MRPFVWLLALSVAAGTLLAPAGGAGAQLLITGNDEKISFDETGKTVTHPPGKDTVSIIDIREPTKPRIVANLPLMNTITGPPVNLAITPDQHLRTRPAECQTRSRPAAPSRAGDSDSGGPRPARKSRLEMDSFLRLRTDCVRISACL